MAQLEPLELSVNLGRLRLRRLQLLSAARQAAFKLLALAHQLLALLLLLEHHLLRLGVALALFRELLLEARL